MAKYYKDDHKKWFDLGRKGQYVALIALAVAAVAIVYLALSQ